MPQRDGKEHGWRDNPASYDPKIDSKRMKQPFNDLVEICSAKITKALVIICQHSCSVPLPAMVARSLRPYACCETFPRRLRFGIFMCAKYVCNCRVHIASTGTGSLGYQAEDFAVNIEWFKEKHHLELPDDG